MVALALGAGFSVAAGGTYPKIEATFSINNLATDPFDYTATDVRVQISQPDGTMVTLPAFYDGGTLWRVRHTPSLPGLYQVTGVTLNGQALAATVAPSSFTILGAPCSPGFVRLDAANETRLVTSNGRRYFPLGQNVAWDTSSATNVAGIMAKLGAAHENWARVWMDHWDGKNLDWPKVGGSFGTLSLTVARKWDSIVTAAEQSGVAFQMTLHHHGQYSSNVDPNWPQNPYNSANGGFLTNAALFFTDATAKALTKRKLRYAVARWGYSPAIMAWELFNEVQFTDAAQNGQWTNVAAWHDEMAQFIRSQDVYDHLITTSSQLDQLIWNQCDYYQHHDYPSDLISALRDPAGVPSGQPTKPIFGGECGMNSTPYYGFHAPIWAGLMGAQSGAAQPWYWDHVDADNAYNLFRAARDFVLAAGIPEQDALAKAAPHVTCPVNSSLVFAPGGGWSTAGQDIFTVGDVAPDGIGTLPSYLQGLWHKPMTPNGYTFLVNYPQTGTFSLQVVETSTYGDSILRILLDGVLKTNVFFAHTNGGPTNMSFTLPIAGGTHTIVLTNAGTDWFTLGNLTFDPYVPIVGAYQISNTNFAALWLWHRTNIYNPSASSVVSGTLPLAGLQAGTYSGTWWDTFGGLRLSNFAFTVAANNPVTLATPSILRSVAFFAGPPPQASVLAPALTQTVGTNASPLHLSLVVTNNGGLPFLYSLCLTGASPVGYAAANSTQTGGPVFAWKDISAIGRELSGSFTALTLKNPKDEGIAGPIDIGFDFPFFSGGQSPDVFTRFYLSPNGFVAFSPFAGDTSTNRSLPSSLAPSNCIAFFWDDLDLSASGRIYCATDSRAGTFTLQFQAVPIKGTSTNVTCQLILKTSGEILMQYKTIGLSNACTVGIQNAACLDALQVAYNQNYLQSGMALRLSPSPWLSISGNAGLVPRWSAETLDVVMDPSGLGFGNYSATLLVRTSDPGLPGMVLPVSLNVLRPIELWRLEHFGSSANAGPGADSADPDQDGLVNLVEYALGLDPNAANPNPLSFSVVADHLTLHYRRPHPAPSDISYISEITTDLASAVWNSGPVYLSQSVFDNGDGTETVTVTDLADLFSAPAHYLRVRFSN